MLKNILVLFVLLVIKNSTSTAQNVERRLALVIGNSKYTSKSVKSLPNPEKDADSMAVALKKCGFTVLPALKNLDKKAFEVAIVEFAEQINKEKYDVGLLFYAGHGMNVKGINYLLPINFEVNTSLSAPIAEVEAQEAGVSLNKIQDAFYAAGENDKSFIIISDACRNNPITNRGNGDIWATRIDKPVPTGIVTYFSTEQGETAREESIYIKTLLKYINAKGLYLEKLMRIVTNEVKLKSSQIPQQWGQLGKDFYFVPNEAQPISDRDFDNVTDNIDRCPDDYGLAIFRGCPDFDEDGIPDVDDFCKNKKGAKINNGCPTVDTIMTVSSSKTTTTLNNSFIEKPNDLNLEMVYVKGGLYKMGCTSEQKDCGADEKPDHEVNLNDFYIGKYEVTESQWENIMGNGIKEYKDGPNFPKTTICWDDTQEFIKKFNEKTGCLYRLPTEAEWEYAARSGGKKIMFGNGKEIADPIEINFEYSLSNKKSYSVFGENRGKSCEVGSLNSSNSLGLYDMSGNLYEWCQDFYDDLYYSKSPVINPQNLIPNKMHVLRGGSWDSYVKFCRVSNRYKQFTEIRKDSYGFRLVLSL